MKALVLTNGVPVMTTITATASITYYDQEVYVSSAIGVAGTGYTADHLTITLPNSKTYTLGNGQLEVYLNGKKLQSDEYSETNSTTITLTQAAPQYSRVSFRIIS